eukprot:Gb_40790 [translate_table: standard]
MGVKCVSVSHVKPAIPTHKHRMFLSAFDLKYIPFKSNIRTILLYKNSIDDDAYGSMVEKLKRSLSLALVHFYPLAGRLVLGEENRHEIECNDAGVEFIEASANVCYRDLELQSSNSAPIFSKLIRMGRSTRFSDWDVPLLSIQVTRFAKGGLSVGYFDNHIAMDGKSIWHFLTSWVELNNGRSLSLAPTHDRTVLKLDQEAMYGNININSGPNEGPATFQGETQGRENFNNKNGEELCYRTFHFSGDMLKSLKQLAMQDGKGPFTTFVAFSSHLWACMMKAEGIAEEKTAYFLIPVDCRSRINPPIPFSFFGNCVHLSIAKTAAGKLYHEGIGYGAGLIVDSINSLTDERLREILSLLERYKHRSVDKEARSSLTLSDRMNDIIGMLERCKDPSIGNDFRRQFGNGQCVLVVQSPKFPVYDTDFGWGRPVNVTTSILERGGVALFRGRDGVSIDATIALPSDRMQILQSLLFFSCTEFIPRL